MPSTKKMFNNDVVNDNVYEYIGRVSKRKPGYKNGVEVKRVSKSRPVYKNELERKKSV